MGVDKRNNPFAPVLPPGRLTDFYRGALHVNLSIVRELKKDGLILMEIQQT
jgi:hypothetical protein